MHAVMNVKNAGNFVSSQFSKHVSKGLKSGIMKLLPMGYDSLLGVGEQPDSSTVLYLQFLMKVIYKSLYIGLKYV